MSKEAKITQNAVPKLHTTIYKALVENRKLIKKGFYYYKKNKIDISVEYITYKDAKQLFDLKIAPIFENHQEQKIILLCELYSNYNRELYLKKAENYVRSIEKSKENYKKRFGEFISPTTFINTTN